jgi:integrase
MNLDEQQISDDWNERKANAHFRREMRYFWEALVALNINPTTLTTAALAENALIRALRWLHKQRRDDNGLTANLTNSVCGQVKSAACTTFAYITPWPKLTSSPSIRATLRAQQREDPTVEQDLELDWEIAQLWEYIRKLPPLIQLAWLTLIGVTIILVRVFGRLRFTELAQLDAEATDPDEQGRWWFVTLIKLHRRPQQICIDTIPEEALDPVRHLLAVRSRVREKKKKTKNVVAGTSFWMGENGEKMTYKQIRNSVIEVMRAAGINNPKPHQLKAAAITELKKRGASEADIVQYARHVHGSRTWAKHYWDADNCRDSTRKLAAIK